MFLTLVQHHFYAVIGQLDNFFPSLDAGGVVVRLHSLIWVYLHALSRRKVYTILKDPKKFKKDWYLRQNQVPS